MLKARFGLTGWWLGILGLSLLLQAPTAPEVAAQSAARPTNPRGTGLGNPLGQPLLDPLGYVRDDAYLRVPIHADDQRYLGLRGDEMKDYLREVVDISLRDRDRGNVFWGRNAGTQGHVEAQDWLEDYFRQYGLEDIRRERMQLPTQWHPQSYEITFTGGGQSFQLESARPARLGESTPPQGLEWELVWAGQGLPADFMGKDVRGKAVLIQDIPLPGEINHSIRNEESVQRAFELGAAAVGIMYGVSDNFSIWEVVGGGPGFNIGYADGRRLLDLLGEGQTVRVTYKLDVDMVDGLEGAHVWGTLPGMTDEDITIVAHLDGYFHSALDNGSGLAVMVGLVDYFASRPRTERRRNIRFAGTVGHHGGGPGTASLAEQLGNTAVLINLEHVAMARTKYWGDWLRTTNAVAPMRWWVYGSQDLLDVTLDALQRFNVGITGDMEPSAGGEIGRIHRLVPSIQIITSPEIKHTEQEFVEWIPEVGLEQIARAYARIIDGVNLLSMGEIKPAELIN
jgi:hypothetical protein